MDFESDIKDYIKGEFSYFGVNYTCSADLDRDLLNLFTVQQKYIYPYKRDVKISSELLQTLSGSKYAADVRHLQLLFANGGNVNHYQSSKLFNHRVHDFLVYSWNIYHLHLSPKRTIDPYFNDRTKEVLFVYISKDKALFIDIDKHPPHEVFADKKLLEIIDNNWPDILEEVNDVMGVSHDLSSKDRFFLRKKGVNEGIVKVNGKVLFCPGEGITTSGDSGAEVRKLLHFKRWLSMNTKFILEPDSGLFFINRYSLTDQPEYKLVFTGNGPQIWDEKTNTCLIKYNEVAQFNKN